MNSLRSPVAPFTPRFGFQQVTSASADADGKGVSDMAREVDHLLLWRVDLTLAQLHYLQEIVHEAVKECRTDLEPRFCQMLQELEQKIQIE
jgi:hypothetical protein